MKKAFRLSLIIIALEFAAAAAIYRYLPELVPIHWNASGEIDNYGSKFFIFLVPGISLAVTLLLYCWPSIVPNGENIKKSGNAYPVLMLMMNLLMTALLIIMAVAALGLPIPASEIMLVMVGILLLSISNYLPKIRPNYSFGIRLPWTLADELVWTKTHRLAGRVFFVIGLLFVGGIAFPAPVNVIIPLAGLLLGTLIITGYAYSVYNTVSRPK